MKAFIIGAGEESIYAIEKAKDLGIVTYAIDGNAKAKGLAVADHSDIIDISDKEAVLEYAKANKIDFIIPTPIGRYLSTIGFCNSELGMKGISYDASLKCTDKFLFHTTLNDANLRPINCQLVTSGNSIQTADLADFTFPVILKPRYGSGSRGISVYNSIEEIPSGETIEEDMVLEEMFSGQEYGVDAKIINGQLDITLVRGKQNINNQAFLYYSLDDLEIYNDVFNKLDQVCRAIKLDNCLLHADIMVEDRNVELIEISGRPSGHSLHNLFTTYATGTDLIDEYLHFQLGAEPRDNSFEKQKLIMYYFNFEDFYVTLSPTKAEFPEALFFENNIKVGDYLSRIKSGADIIPRGKVILKYNNVEDINNIIEGINNKFGGKYEQ